MLLDGDANITLDGGSDASDWGCGGEVDIDGDTEEHRVPFVEHEQQQDINWRELAGVVVLCERLGERLRNKRLHLRVDNAVTLFFIKRGTGKHKKMMELLRRLSRLQARYNFSLEPVHVPGAVHFRSDELSRKDAAAPPLAPRLRRRASHARIAASLWHGFDVVRGSEFTPRVSQPVTFTDESRM
jgi:hypothetical protein